MDASVGLRELEERLAGLRAAAGSLGPDGRVGLLVAEEAFAAAAAGNYGVGAVLLDPDGEVIERGRNEVFNPRFRSDRHAEMVVLTSFEDRVQRSDMRGYTLVTSLEPCLMCTGRIILAGVETVRFLALDDWGGMATHLDDLPPAWDRLRQRQRFTEADVTDDLRRFALDCFELNLDRLRDELAGR